MLITLPADAYGGPSPVSVLDLEPLLQFARQSRPHAISLSAPAGPDDLPNGAALLAMRDRLAEDGFQTVAAPWVAGPAENVTDPGWQMATLFEARAMVAAVGEAGLDLLTVRWLSAPDQSDAALLAFLERLLEEAERTGVKIALNVPEPGRLGAVMRQSEHPLLGASLSLHDAEGSAGLVLDNDPRLRLAATHLTEDVSSLGPGPFTQPIASLVSAGFKGPLLLEKQTTPSDYAKGVVILRELVAAS